MDFERPEDVYPLSPMQQGMLFQTLNWPGSGVCFEQDSFTIRGGLAVERFLQAWEQVVARHPILRTTFLWEDLDEPHQVIHRKGDVECRMEDWRSDTADEQKRKGDAYLLAERKRGFDLTSLPLMRFGLFRLADERYQFVWNFHHAILDGWSLPVVIKEVLALYEGGDAPGDQRSTPSARPYRDYIAWLLRQDLSKAETHWRNVLKGFTAPTPLVVDQRTQADSQVTDDTFDHCRQMVSESLTASLTSFARTNRLTLSTLVQGAWALMLGRYSRADEVVFGCNIAGRPPALRGVESMVGLFINTLPMRVSTSSGALLVPWLKALQDQVLELNEYEFSPLVQVQKWSDVAGGKSLFDSIVIYGNYPAIGPILAGGTLQIEHQSLTRHSKTGYPLSLLALPGDQLALEIKFDRRRFDPLTIKRMLGHVQTLLEGMVAGPSQYIERIPMLERSERAALIGETGPSPASTQAARQSWASEATLHGLFEAQADRSPDAVALTYEGSSLTYRQVNAMANGVARELISRGVKPDTLVGLCLDRTSELVVAILAILKAGGAYLPIDLSYPADRVAFMLEDAQAPLLLTDRKLAGKISATRAQVLYVDDLLARPTQTNQQSNLPHLAGCDNLAYVIYTSGTTGKPKGTLIPHRNVVRLFSSTETWFGFNEQDVWTLFHSAAFDFSVWEIWGALLYGGRVVVVPFLVSRSPEIFYELLAKERVTVLNQTPSAFRQLIQAEETVGRKALALRYVIFGGEALELQSLRPWFERHGDQSPRLVNMYGITETTVHVTYRPLSMGDLNSGSVIGVPIPDLNIVILDQHMEPVPVGVPGEMYVGGAGLAKGYLRRPELTAERFIPNHLTQSQGARLYRTGDLARFLPGMDIEYLGRVDHQVKIRGFRIELGEIESVLNQHPGVREAVVMVREDVPGVKTLAAYLVSAHPMSELTVLREHLKKKVPDYMVPAAFVFLDRFPLTNNGKIDRKALPAPDTQRSDLARTSVAPRTPVEEKLAAIWSHVLRVDRVGIHDNFFELGGDSILIIQAVSLARREGLMLGPKQMFAHQTIAELAASVEISAEAQPARAAPTGDVQLTPIQQWFFEQDLEDLHHYNQAFLLTVKERLERGMLEEAVKQLGRHHDALRLRFRREEGYWRQTYAPSDAPSIIQWVDLAQLKPAERTPVIESATRHAQASLDLANGPIWRIVYFNSGHDACDRLLIVVHHLAVDGISWRPLVEDLETICRQLKAGQQIQLPARTVSYQEWAEALLEFSTADAVKAELPYWLAATRGELVSGQYRRQSGAVPPNRESEAVTVKTSLNVAETQALLQEVPSAYNTQINDILLTAVAHAWSRSGRGALYTNLEGHGREPLLRDLDLSRTVGWFTSIFPVRLDLPATEGDWLPGESLKYVKEQLRHIPRRGIGYGALRYLAGAGELASRPEPDMVFNYMGQFDQVLAGSTLFGFAPESTGPWHSPFQQRRYALEVNGMVTAGCLELTWTYAPAAYTAAELEKLTREFLLALRALIAHCQSPNAGGRTPSDFPLARLDQTTVDRIMAWRPEIQDVYPLSPIQSLFYSVNPGTMLSEFDQWHCRLNGPLVIDAFQHAWHDTVRRHSILRSAIYSDGLGEPLQVVLRQVKLPWKLEDWPELSPDEEAARWTVFLEKDREQSLNISEAPVMRFSLVRITNERSRFLWTVPALLLDGWSWPIVFREVSQLYGELVGEPPAQLEPARPYRTYVEWGRGRSNEQAAAFWRENLKGFQEPTPLPAGAQDGVHAEKPYSEHQCEIPAEATEAIQSMAQRLRVSVSTIVQGAWALLLNRQSACDDLVFGTAFAGRPVELPGADTVVGPFVNNVPIRIQVVPDSPVAEFLQRMHARILEVSPYQYLPLLEIQDCSEVPWRHRLFDSLVVFQNYAVDEAARRLGNRVDISDFSGPIHTAYPLLLLVEPGATLRMTLVYDRKRIAGAVAESLTRDLSRLMASLPTSLDRSVRSLQAELSPPSESRLQTRRIARIESQNAVPPQTDTEKAIALVWQKMFGLDRVGVDDNLFELGGHSLLLVQLHARLRTALKKDFPLVTLFTYPTVRSLARFCEPGAGPADNTTQLRTRAQQQREALAALRNKRGTN